MSCPRCGSACGSSSQAAGASASSRPGPNWLKRVTVALRRPLKNRRQLWQIPTAIRPNQGRSGAGSQKHAVLPLILHSHQLRASTIDYSFQEHQPALLWCFVTNSFPPFIPPRSLFTGAYGGDPLPWWRFSRFRATCGLLGASRFCLTPVSALDSSIPEQDSSCQMPQSFSH